LHVYNKIIAENPSLNMRTRKLLFAFTTIVATVFFFSCKHQPDDMVIPLPENCDLTGVTYPGTVVPILESNCVGCHNSQINNGGINLTDYSTLSNLASSGKLAGVINQAPGYTSMPPNTKIDSCDILKIEKWINDTTFTSHGGDEHPCDPDTIYFQNTILPLILSSCATTNCHDKLTDEQDVLLVDYASIIEYGKIKPGDPNDSELYEKIMETDPDDRMPPPPVDPLTNEQKNNIKKWIEQGALNNACDEDCDTTDVSFSNHIWPLVENNCLGCHSGGTPGGGIYLNNYAGIVAVAESGQLWGAINHQQGFSPMPKNANKLSDCKIKQVQIWIEDGTPDN
jgi:mono/diheme cytochrome c family protein